MADGSREIAGVWLDYTASASAGPGGSGATAKVSTVLRIMIVLLAVG
jgi:hypothetical protein